jgi:hypothetical protein
MEKSQPAALEAGCVFYIKAQLSRCIFALLLDLAVCSSIGISPMKIKVGSKPKKGTQN